MKQDTFSFTLDPFGPDPDPRFLVLTPPHREALATLVYALDQREGWALLQGGAGLGKTSLLQALMLQLEPSVISAVVSRPHRELLPLFNQMALSLGLAGPYGSKGRFLEEFRSLLERLRRQGQILLLVIDDAQLLTPEQLTEIRLLGNEDMQNPRVLNLFLAARPLIQVQMERAHERGLHQLLHRQPQLAPLDREQSVQYVGHRLEIAGGDPSLFQPEAIGLLHQAGHGVPRSLNSLCRLCLEQAGANRLESIGPDTVRRVLDQAPRIVSIPGQGWVSPDEKPLPPSPVPGHHDRFPTPDNPWDACAHPQPRPRIGPEEQKLEHRLMNRCHNQYRGMSWWDKTTDFTVEWDNLRRARLGILGPSFPSFCPRWVDQRWGALNLARRAADYEGAPYAAWIAAQYQRVLGSALGELPLEELSSPEAVEHYRRSLASPEPAAQAPVEAPFDWEQFDPQSPEHSAHAEQAIDEIFDLANYVCAQEHQTAEDLLTEAVCQAVLPLKALQNLPKVQQYVAEALDRRAQAPAPPPDEHPPIII
ncbi:MAG: AAA family ATPase [Desulfarculaceae bacterium]|nr:AAA family ATPase [Desulfarculaceae bacterium]MCF8074196.1 AAA family ATPase [Desulfarculaceae bacterium]MCF8102777.1 AAA family ATPase [Desulfarculaceae bacterium]MCF8116368.1 AAA family ATPase [Desulfarculaceae bacterium]